MAEVIGAGAAGPGDVSSDGATKEDKGGVAEGQQAQVGADVDVQAGPSAEAPEVGDGSGGGGAGDGAGQQPDGPVTEPCPECFPGGWPEGASSVGCAHGQWSR